MEQTLKIDIEQSNVQFQDEGDVRVFLALLNEEADSTLSHSSPKRPTPHPLFNPQCSAKVP